MTEDQYEKLYTALARRCNAEDLAPIDLAEAAAETKWPLCLDVLRWSANRSATEQEDLAAWLAANPGALARDGIDPLVEYFARMALATDIAVKAEHLREDASHENEAVDLCDQCGGPRYMTLTGEVCVNACSPEDEEASARVALQAALEVVREERTTSGPLAFYVKVRDASALLDWIRVQSCEEGHATFMAIRTEMGAGGELRTPRCAADWNALYEACQGSCTAWIDGMVWALVGRAFLSARGVYYPYGESRPPGLHFVDDTAQSAPGGVG